MITVHGQDLKIGQEVFTANNATRIGILEKIDIEGDILFFKDSCDYCTTSEGLAPFPRTNINYQINE